MIAASARRPSAAVSVGGANFDIAISVNVAKTGSITVRMSRKWSISVGDGSVAYSKKKRMNIN